MLHAPADPVKKTFFSSSTTIFNILFCSSLSITSWTLSVSPPAIPSIPDRVRTDTFGEKNESSVVLGCLAGRLTLAGKSLVDLRLVRILFDGIEDGFAIDFVILNKY